ncbi:MAG: penicillin-binding transpeptidase domain-containing protein, partial [Chloroflexia bacterium]
FSVTITTTLVGDVQENNLLTLVQESGAWRVQWTPSLIFKDLSGDNRIRAVAEPATRGAIFDRKGKALAVDGELTQLGIVPGDIANEQNLLAQVSKAVGQTPQEIKAEYKGKNPAWLIPIADLPRDQAERIQQELADSPGVSFTKRTAREYPQRAVLAQILGYVGPIYAEDLNKPEYKGYSPNDFVGKTGLEAWGEKYLRGRPGGKLFIATPDEVEVKVIKETPYAPGNNIYLNIDLDLQVAVEQEMKGRKGSVVSLNPNNGEILTLASQPSYDLNQFVTGISQKDWERLNSEAAGYPLINRATASSFPMASTFKPITLGAALSAPLDNLDRTWYDTGAWDKDGTKRGDWKPGGHGYITLLDGLIQSCDIVFYDLGWELYQRDYDYLSTFTRQWLLGQKYGVEGVVEASGRVPAPAILTQAGRRATT